MYGGIISEIIVEILLTWLAGASFIIIGLLLWTKQKIQLMHDYHCRNVKRQDVRAYTRLWGIGLTVWGVCIGLIGVVNHVSRTQYGWGLFLIGMATCLILGNKAQKTYNGSWFS